MDTLGPVEGIIILIAIAVFLVSLIGGIDAATKPEPQRRAAGQSKMLWVLGQLLGAFFCGIVGLIFAIIYWSSIRQQVITAGGAPPAPPPTAY